jgi:hypothetical protein
MKIRKKGVTMKSLRVLAIAVLATASTGHSQVMYKCGSNYSQLPCAPGAKEIPLPKAGSAECSGSSCIDQLRARIKDDIDGSERAGKMKVEDKPPSEGVISTNKAACEAAIKLRLKDPESARFKSILRMGTFMGYRDGKTYPYVKYAAAVNAKNSYGAYAGETNWQCSFDASESGLMSVSEGGQYR